MAFPIRVDRPQICGELFWIQFDLLQTCGWFFRFRLIAHRFENGVPDSGLISRRLVDGFSGFSLIVCRFAGRFSDLGLIVRKLVDGFLDSEMIIGQFSGNVLNSMYSGLILFKYTQNYKLKTFVPPLFPLKFKQGGTIILYFSVKLVLVNLRCNQYHLNHEF